MCSGSPQKGALSLWIAENSTGLDEQRMLWHSASEARPERGWRLVTLPLYGLVDWYAERPSGHVNKRFDRTGSSRSGTLRRITANKSAQQTSHVYTHLSARKPQKAPLSYFQPLINADFSTFTFHFLGNISSQTLQKLMNPVGTPVLCHGPSMCTVVENIPLSVFHFLVIEGVEINTQDSTHPTRLPISNGPDFPSKRREIKTK